MSIRYERVRIKKNGNDKARTIYLQDPAIGDLKGIATLYGERVNKVAESISTKHETIEIVALSLITRRTEVYFNGKYGTLETEKWDPANS